VARDLEGRRRRSIAQSLLGMPARVRGFGQLGRFHQIEVEDNVSAYLEYSNGATGTFVSSTGEAPGTNRFEIVGTRGKLVLERDKLSFTRNESDMVQFSKTAKLGFAKPEVWNVEIPFENAANPHAILVQNFVNAILDGEPLIAPGEEGIHSVELANVILFSSLLEQTVKMPMDSASYEKKLNQLIAESTLQKKVVEVSNEDFTKSFNR
jgi:predicted dehydrogenase